MPVKKTSWLKFVLITSVFLLRASGLHAATVIVEPDDFPLYTELTNAVPGVTLTVDGEPGTIVRSDFFVETRPGWPANPNNFATTGILVFGQDPNACPTCLGAPVWDQVNHGMLRADFAQPTSFVQIDIAFGDDDIGILQAFSYSGILLAEVEGSGDGRAADPSDRYFRPIISRTQRDIAYIIAGGKNAEGLFLDNLQFDRAPGCSGLAPGRGGTVPPGQLSPPGCSGFAPGHQNGPPVSAVPLPASLPLLLSALAGLWGICRWRRA